jgi:hypothetical protein
MRVQRREVDRIYGDGEWGMGMGSEGRLLGFGCLVVPLGANNYTSSA